MYFYSVRFALSEWCVSSLRSNFCCSNNMPTSTASISSLPASLTHSARTDHHQFNLCVCECSFCWAKSRKAISSHTSQMVGVGVRSVVAVLFFPTFASASSNVSNKSRINPICYLNRLKLVFVRRSFMNVVCYCCCCYYDMRAATWYDSIGHLYTFDVLDESTTKTILITLIFVACFEISILNSLLALLLARSFSQSRSHFSFFILWNVFAFLFFYSANVILFSFFPPNRAK